MGCGCGGGRSYRGVSVTGTRRSTPSSTQLQNMQQYQRPANSAAMQPATAPSYIIESQTLAQRRILARRQV